MYSPDWKLESYWQYLHLHPFIPFRFLRVTSLAGYQQVESPFEIIGAKEKALQDFVMCHKENTGKPTQIVAECQRLWNSLDTERQCLLEHMTVQAACEKSMRLACFHRKTANLETNSSDKEITQSIFRNLYSNSSDEAFPILLSETVYMPMAAFVKDVEPVTKTEEIAIV